MCYSTMDCYNSESSRNGVLHYGTVVGETERVKVIEGLLLKSKKILLWKPGGVLWQWAVATAGVSTDPTVSTDDLCGSLL